MNYSKEYILNFSQNTHFVSSNIEKEIRLISVLRFIFCESSFSDKLVLKGGTAINLIYTNLKRLSVDIDLDYHGSLDLSVTINEREQILKELDNRMIRDGYELSNRSRKNTILSSRVYNYTNSSGNKDAIKVEINFIDRVAIYPTIISHVSYFEKEARIINYSLEELFGMKIAALIDRCKPRDLYDTYYFIKNIHYYDKIALKKCALFYLSLDGIYKINNDLFGKIMMISSKNIKRELLPVINKEENFSLEIAIDCVISFLKSLFTLSENEIDYLERFQMGDYQPKLLFNSGKELFNASNHPMAKWRTMKSNKKI